MTQLLFIETFVLGASTIAAIYHLVLYIQQRDKFLLFYSIHLLTLSAYILFKLLSSNYNPFLPTGNLWNYITEETLQGAMVTVYVIFAAITLDVAFSRSNARTVMYIFFGFCILFYSYQLYNAFEYGPGVKSIQAYMVTRLSLVGIAAIALIFAWTIRTSIFHRTIIIGSLVYDFSWLVSIISLSTQTTILGLNGIEIYLLGCLLDIIIFSSALGYRVKTMAEEKNELVRKEAEARLAIEKTRTGIAMNLHDDIGSVLSSMSVYGEAAKRALKENNVAKVDVLIDKIGVNARETMDNMSDIVWTINPVNDNGFKLFNRMESFASSVLNAKEIELKFEVGKELYEKGFLMPVRQNVFFIFKEIITNCVKHSGATNVEAIFTLNGSNLLLLVSDNGKGFDTKNNHLKNASGGNGLKNIKERASVLNGTIEVKSSANGTETKLEFPLT
ncbi:MAG: hypothetical protein IPJ93_08805 [Bacteroidota bacterium]|nr:MAG: hypothetical protein IPJ93_08805 [Bacteroidota bacterium]